MIQEKEKTFLNEIEFMKKLNKELEKKKIKGRMIAKVERGIDGAADSPAVNKALK